MKRGLLCFGGGFLFCLIAPQYNFLCGHTHDYSSASAKSSEEPTKIFDAWHGAAAIFLSFQVSPTQCCESTAKPSAGGHFRHTYHCALVCHEHLLQSQTEMQQQHNTSQLHSASYDAPLLLLSASAIFDPVRNINEAPI